MNGILVRTRKKVLAPLLLALAILVLPSAAAPASRSPSPLPESDPAMRAATDGVFAAFAAELIATLARITEPEVREVLEHELWSYRKLYASVGDAERADGLGSVHGMAFPEFSLSRWDPMATGTVGPPPDTQPLSLLPAQISALNRLLLGWLILTTASLLLLLIDRWQRPASWKAGQLPWFPIVLLFGVPGWVAYRLAGGWPQGPRTVWLGTAWRRALGPSLFTATGSMAGLLLALRVISAYFPDMQKGAIPSIGAMFLVSWLLFQAPLAALEQKRSYLASVQDTFRHCLAATFFLLLGAVPAMIYLAEGLFLHVTPDNPLFLVVLILSGTAGAVTVYPYSLWSLRRGRAGTSQDTLLAPTEG